MSEAFSPESWNLFWLQNSLIDFCSGLSLNVYKAVHMHAKHGLENAQSEETSVKLVKTINAPAQFAWFSNANQHNQYYQIF